jgi:hypothetical protein
VSNPAGLDQIAAAGGTNAAIDVSAGPAAFINALNSIRQKVSVTSSHPVVTQQKHTVTSHTSTPVSTTIRTQQVISTALDCQWKIPTTTGTKQFDPDLVNMQLTDSTGSATQFGKVASPNDCATAGDGWYYDDNAAPTQIFVCSKTCETLKASTGARVDILLGCPTTPAIAR